MAYTGFGAAGCKVRYTIRNSSGKEIVTLTSPVQNFTAPGTKFFVPNEFFRWNAKYDNATYLQIARTNRFPEGNFTIDAKITDAAGNTTYTSASSSFTIIYPTPAALIAPLNETTENRLRPTFIWTPVNLPAEIPFRYQFRLVKVANGQTVLNALKNNIPVYEDLSISANSLQYPVTGLPLENGQTYAWRVKVADTDGNPLTTNDGNSEFWTFTYYSGMGSSTTALNIVELERGVAWFTDFTQIQISEENNLIRMNGRTKIYLKLADSSAREFTANVQNLTFKKNQYNPFSFTAGSVVANLPAAALPARLLTNQFTASTLEFNVFDKLFLKGQADVPGSVPPIRIAAVIPIIGGRLSGTIQYRSGTNNLLSNPAFIKLQKQPVLFAGTANLRLNGFSNFGGSISSGTAALQQPVPAGEPIYSFGNDAVRVNITGLDIVYPQAVSRFSGELKIFENYVAAYFRDVRFNAEGYLIANFDTTFQMDIPFFPESKGTYYLRVQGLAGSFRYNPSTRVGEIWVTLREPQFMINLNGVFSKPFTASGKFNGALRYSSSVPADNGAQFANLKPFTVDGTPVADNPIVFDSSTHLAVTSINFDSIKYTGSKFDFYLRLSGNYIFPKLSNLKSVVLDTIPFTKDGIQLPALRNTGVVAAGGNNPKVSSGVRYRISGLNMPGLTIRSSAGVNLNMKIGFDISLPNMPAGTLGELMNFEESVQAAATPSGYVITIPERDYTSAEVPLGGGVMFLVKRFSGKISLVGATNPLELTPAFKVLGQIRVPNGFLGCSASKPITLGQGNIIMNGFGQFSGNQTNFILPCPISAGLMPLSSKSLKLEFAYDKNGQQLNLAGPSVMDISPLTGKPVSVAVNLNYDFIKGEFKSLDGALPSGDTLRLPNDNPVFNIAIKNLVITRSGITLNGRTGLRFSNGGNAGATCDSAKFSFETARLVSGRIVIDNGVGMRINLADGDNRPRVDYVKSDSAYPASNGLQVTLPATVILNKDGVEVNGTGSAKLRYNGNEFTLDAGFGRFNSQYAPFSITAGEIAFSANNRNCAWLKPSGFSIDLSLLSATALPERLALKDSSVAYLTLREGNTLLVDSRRLGGDTLQISTKPGSTVKAVFPGLALNSGTVPALDVAFSITVDKNSYNLLGGSVAAEVPADKLALFNLTNKDESEGGLLNLPLKIKRFKYENLNGTARLSFGAILAAFGEDLRNEPLTLEVDDEGFLKADIAALQLNKTFRPRSGMDSDRVLINLSRVTGTVNTNIRNFTAPGYSLDFKGSIGISDTTSEYSNVVMDINLSGSGLTISGSHFDYPARKVLHLRHIQLEVVWIELDSLKYSSTEGWGFSMRMDVAPGFLIGASEFRPRWFTDVVVNNDGINFPRIIQNDLESRGVGGGTLNGTAVQIRNVRAEEYLLSTISPDSIDYESWGIELDLKAKLPANVKEEPASSDLAAFGDSISFADGNLSGKFKCLPAGYLYVELGLSYLYFYELTGSIDGTEIVFAIDGNVALPRTLRDRRGVAVPVKEISMDAAGKLSGEISVVMKNAAIRVLGQPAMMTNIDLAFDTSSSGEQALNATIAADVAVTLPGQPVIKAPGEFEVDLITGKLDDESAIEIRQPFELALPEYTKPFLRFAVDSAVIDNSGLVVSGPAKLKLRESSKTVKAEFEDFVVSPLSFAYREGTVNVMKEFGLSVKSLPNKPLEYAAVDTGYVPVAENEVNILIPEEFTIDSTYFTLEDESELKFRYGNKFYKDISAAAFENPVLRFSDFKVTKGKISFMKDEERVGYIDASGFNVNLLSLVELPEEIMLGSRKTAYLVVREEGETFVRVDDIGDKLRLTTDAGKKVKLYIPALAKDSTDIPSYDVTFNITVTKSNFEIVDGGITVSGTREQPLFSLSKFGVPLSVVKLGYQKEEGVYKFTAEASIKLPPAIASDTLNVVLKVDENGNVQAKGAFGKVQSTFNSKAVYFKEFKAGSYAEFKLDGLQLDLGGKQTVFKLSGDIYSNFFKDGSSANAKQVPMHFIATYENSQYKFGITPARELKVFVLGFKPLPNKKESEMLSLTIPENADDFALGFSGIIKVDSSISKDLSFTVNGLKVSKNNVYLPEVSCSVPQVINVFGSKLTLKDKGTQKGIALGYDNGIFSITTSGTLEIMNKALEFTGLTIRSNGDISVNTIAPKPALQVIPNAMWVNSLAVSSQNGTSYLTVNGNVQLPKPAQQTPQNYSIKIGSDGTIQGSAKIVLFNYSWDAPTVPNRFEKSIWKGKFVIPYAAVNVSLGENSSASLEVGCKLFLDAAKDKYVVLGQQLTPNQPVPVNYQAGITLSTNGSIKYGPLTTKGLTDFDFGPLKLSDLTFSSEENGDTYGVKIGGQATLNISSVKGSLKFSNLKITTDPEFTAPSITGGNLEVTNVLRLEVNNIKFQDGGQVEIDTVIIAKNTDGTTTRTQGKKTIAVNSYISFGGKVSISALNATGGIDQFLAYTTSYGEYFYIRNAKLTIKNAVDLTLNLKYERESSGFKILVSGTGKIGKDPNPIGVAAVGKLGVKNGDLSMGVFVAVTSGLQISIAKIVVLTGIGGGFFYRPEQEDLDEVKKVCGIKSPKSGTKMNNASASANPTFAVLVYTRMAVGSKALLDCKNLITITDESFCLSGDATLLSQADRLDGSYELTLKFTEVFVEGAFEINLKIGSIVKGQANLEAWIYGTSNWGVKGDLTFEVPPAQVKGGGSFYAGNKGFYVKFTISQSVNYWVVSINAGLTVSAWYKHIENDWGAYFKVWVDVSVLGGVAGFKGDMRGILVNTPSFLLAGTASGSVRLLFVSWSGSVWAKIKSNGLDGGFGRDSEIEGRMAKAETIADEMKRASQQAKADMGAAKAALEAEAAAARAKALAEWFASIFHTPSQMAKLGQALSDSAVAVRAFPLNTANGEYSINEPMAMIADSLEDFLALFGLGNGTYRASVGAVRYRLHNSDNWERLISAESNITNMAAAFRAYETTVGKMGGAFDKFEQDVNASYQVVQQIQENPLQDPVSSASFAPPVKKESPGPDEGPGFTVNGMIAGANSVSVNAVLNRSAEYQRALAANMGTVLQVMQRFDNNFANTSNFYALSNQYADIRVWVNNAYALLAQARLDDYQKILDTSAIASLRVVDRSLFDAWDPQWTNGVTMKIGSPPVFYEHRLRKLAFSLWYFEQRLAGKASNNIAADWNTFYSTIWQRIPAYTSGQEPKAKYLQSLYQNLLLNLPKTAYAKLEEFIPTTFSMLDAQRLKQIAVVDQIHGSFTERMNELFNKRKDMLETLLKLTDLAIHAKLNHPDPAVQAEMYQLVSLRNQIVQGTVPPWIYFTKTVWTNNRSHSAAELEFWGLQNNSWTPAPIAEYQVKVKGGRWVSFGRKNSLRDIVLPSGKGIGTKSLPVYVKARTTQGYASTILIEPKGEAGFDKNALSVQPAVAINPFSIQSTVPVGLQRPQFKNTIGRMPSINANPTFEYYFRQKFTMYGYEAGLDAYANLGYIKKTSDITVSVDPGDFRDAIKYVDYQLYRIPQDKGLAALQLYEYDPRGDNHTAYIRQNGRKVSSALLGQVYTYTILGLNIASSATVDDPNYGTFAGYDSLYILMVTPYDMSDKPGRTEVRGFIYDNNPVAKPDLIKVQDLNPPAWRFPFPASANLFPDITREDPRKPVDADYPQAVYSGYNRQKNAHEPVDLARYSSAFSPRRADSTAVIFGLFPAKGNKQEIIEVRIFNRNRAPVAGPYYVKVSSLAKYGESVGFAGIDAFTYAVIVNVPTAKLQAATRLNDGSANLLASVAWASDDNQAISDTTMTPWVFNYYPSDRREYFVRELSWTNQSQASRLPGVTGKYNITVWQNDAWNVGRLTPAIKEVVIRKWLDPAGKITVPWPQDGYLRLTDQMLAPLKLSENDRIDVYPVFYTGYPGWYTTIKLKWN